MFIQCFSSYHNKLNRVLQHRQRLPLISAHGPQYTANRAENGHWTSKLYKPSKLTQGAQFMLTQFEPDLMEHLWTYSPVAGLRSGNGSKPGGQGQEKCERQ